MYDLIILGIIPGTHEQLNFDGYLLILSVLLAVFDVLFLVHKRSSPTESSKTTEHFDVITL